MSLYNNATYIEILLSQKQMIFQTASCAKGRVKGKEPALVILTLGFSLGNLKRRSPAPGH